MNPWEARQGGIGKTGRKAEKKTAKALGAKLQPMSGARGDAKGDMTVTARAGNFLIEHKSTSRDSLGLKLDWLLKIKKEAIQSGNVPAITVEFTTDSGISRERWVMVPDSVWREIVS